MKIIAHAISDPQTAKLALQNGVDSLEIDVSKRILFNKFTAQHNSLMGILGFGPILENILTAEVKTRAFLDLKPVSFRNTFANKLANLLLKLKVKNAKICGHNWQLISAICEKTNSKPFYTIKDKYSAQKFKQQLHLLKKPAGFSIRHTLINKSLIRRLKSEYPVSELWAWTVNDLKEAKRLADLKVDGIITDEWKILRNLAY